MPVGKNGGGRRPPTPPVVRPNGRFRVILTPVGGGLPPRGVLSLVGEGGKSLTRKTTIAFIFLGFCADFWRVYAVFLNLRVLLWRRFFMDGVGITTPTL